MKRVDHYDQPRWDHSAHHSRGEAARFQPTRGHRGVEPSAQLVNRSAFSGVNRWVLASNGRTEFMERQRAYLADMFSLTGGEAETRAAFERLAEDTVDALLAARNRALRGWAN